MVSENPAFSRTSDAAPSAAAHVIAAAFSDKSASLEAVADRARDYADAARSASTRRAYAADVRHFAAWCAGRGLASLPAESATLALYLTTLADGGAAFATIRRRIAAVNGAHRDLGHEPPSANRHVQTIVAGIGKTIGTKQHRKDALGVELLRRALETCDSGLRGSRDRAILLLGFSGAFRRSELAALDVADLAFGRKGLLVTLRRSKTDQAAAGREVAIPLAPVAAMCAVRATRGWIELARLESGPLFRGVAAGAASAERISDVSIARLVKRAAKAAGIAGDFGAHSLRAGFVTSAAEARVPDRNIARVTGHRDGKTLAGYVRRANAFDDPALLEIIR